MTQLIRALANDMIFSQAGEILTDSANFEFPLLNAALTWFTRECVNHGVDTFTIETVLPNVSAIATLDPGLQVNISDTGYFDTAVNHALPQLPTDLLVPTFMWERQSGSTEEWIGMRQILDGLPSRPQSSRLGIWEWRQDGIYMLGATQSNDLRLRFKGRLAYFATPQDSLLFRGAAEPIALRMVYLYLMSKNPDAAELAASEAKMYMGQIATSNARMKQQTTNTRRSYGSARRGNSFNPPTTSTPFL